MGSIDRGQKSFKIGFTALALGLFGCAGSPPTNLGIKDNKLAPCPSSPNCVSSYSESADHKVSPWPFAGTPEEAHDKLIKLLNQQENVTIVEDSPNYVRAEFKSALLGFVDDVEWVIGTSQIDVRSASRIGYSDLGVNRKRVDELKIRFRTQL